MIDDDPDLPPITLRYLLNPRNWRTEAAYWAYAHGMRGYCWVHDSHRWAWTHRSCAWRHHEVGSRLARALQYVPPRAADCTNVSEPDGVPCTGTLLFHLADVQAKCDTCGAWCGSAVANYRPAP